MIVVIAGPGISREARADYASAVVNPYVPVDNGVFMPVSGGWASVAQWPDHWSTPQVRAVIRHIEEYMKECGIYAWMVEADEPWCTGPYGDLFVTLYIGQYTDSSGIDVQVHYMEVCE